MTFREAPPLPAWIARELPYRRRTWTHASGRTLHFIDTGEGLPVVMLHGNPMWCLLWRKVIAELVGAPVRIIAPDLLGLGLSDKPLQPAVHTLDLHRRTQAELLDALELDRYVLVGQDWGGPIAAGIAALRPERVAGAVFANTAIHLPSAGWGQTNFHRFARLPVLPELLFRHTSLFLRSIHRAQGDPAGMPRHIRRAYRWPLRRREQRIAPLALARMVPDGPNHPTVSAYAEGDAWARSFQGPVSLVWGSRDPILGKAVHRMTRHFPNAPLTSTEAGHFLQEEVPEALAAAILQVAEHVRGGR